MCLGLIFLIYGFGIVIDVLGDFAIFIGMILAVLAIRKIRRKIR